MKALTLWQPWASLIAVGWKRFETRSWQTRYRGKLAIHAAKRPPPPMSASMAQLLEQAFGLDWAEALPRASIVAAVELEGCVPTESLAVDATERLVGDWSHGRFAWALTNLHALDPPIRWRGRQGLFNIPDRVLA